jgi:hypothetical protein
VDSSRHRSTYQLSNPRIPAWSRGMIMTPSRTVFMVILWSLTIWAIIVLVAMILTYFAETNR